MNRISNLEKVDEGLLEGLEDMAKEAGNFFLNNLND